MKNYFCVTFWGVLEKKKAKCEVLATIDQRKGEFEVNNSEMCKLGYYKFLEGFKWYYLNAFMRQSGDIIVLIFSL